ncbi:hypothetical protein TBLA_0B09550 [Henningerozyma blattae CBS 6284]|uniref:Ribosomal RNA-processing protein 42 n=1 Tax=Henningerozyma blattae (strain ATCC 34711 / CBS 6284 / DSM 70876 / NBRC 10599 / NRRL Y-10934 / UCD 77-7) TaxID=1071380 RepID=I2H070_HENB6|nr:hypothetical protein TBLA_0B09550 [Tetrapisispora blattae CBS 6284]CCH59772.1 hypothetical protein TBLA_0B09550 [Tetrapisispora blattae CBS 6284]
MSLSVTEKSYLYNSLSSSPSVRPDGRLDYQFRAIEITTDFLTSSNGSSRIIASDGSECIVSIKSKVIDHTVLQPDDSLVEVTLDISGQRDDSPMVESISSLLREVYSKTIDKKSLTLTTKYSFKLYIDVLVISTYSNPISLISMAIFSALNSTYLPKLVSSFDDIEVEELPTFHDYDMIKFDVNPPLIFLVIIVGNNVFIDPALNESEIANNSLIITWNDNKISPPIRSLALNDTYCEGFKPQLLQRSMELVEKCANGITAMLQDDK